ncbi:MAG: DNA-3-methyladenine glycosylase family protein [Acidimicrobiales bacterium]
MLETTITLRRPLDLRLTLSPLRHGAADPCTTIGTDEFWRATNTTDGPATVHLRVDGAVLLVRSWGPGAERAVAGVPALVGQSDDDGGFRPAHPVVATLARRLVGLRVPRTGAVVEALVPTVLGQKVTSAEATSSYRALARALGEPAPGPAGGRGLVVPPTPSRLGALASYTVHTFGVERRRAETIGRACRVPGRLEEAAGMAPTEAVARLTALAGIGPWTAAKVAFVAMGDADAVCTGDFHLPHQVSWALAGEARGDDARMLELLEPFRGHRARVQRLIVAAGIQAPRYGPRYAARRSLPVTNWTRT